MRGASDGTVVVAETQTEGRGRLGREWFSPPGTGLYFSVILHPRLPAADLPYITLTAGVAVCEAVERECQVSLGIKWPNDLYLDNKKLGGILCETGPATQAHGDSGGILVVLGIGLNVSTPEAAFPESLRGKATSLLAFSGRKYSRQRILEAVLARLEDDVFQLENRRFSEILARWRCRDILLDATLSWLDPKGAIIIGKSLGIDDNGRYHIRDKDGNLHQVISGDLSRAGKQ